MQEQTYGKWKKLSVYAVISIGIYIGIRCLFTAVFPFFAALLLMKLFYPPALWLKKKLKIGKGISVFVLFVIFLGSVGIALWLLVQKLFGQIGEVFQDWDMYQRYADDFLQGCCCWMEESFGLRAEYIKPFLLGRFYTLIENVGDNISKGIMTYSYCYARGVVKIIGVMVVIMVVTVLLAKDYDKLHKQMEKNAFYDNIRILKEKVFYAGFIFIRAQLIITMLISAVCIFTLFLMKVDNALLIGSGIGLLDALPFLGTGLVLIPWAIIQLFRGQWLSAAVIGTLYLLCSFIREFLEPKLIGHKLGILPVYIIAAIYIGIVLYGVSGVLLGPLQALLTMELGRQWIEEHS